MIPVTVRSTVDSRGAGSSSSSSSGSSTDAANAQLATMASVTTKSLSPLLSSMYDGDTALLTSIDLVNVTYNQPLAVTAAILVQVGLRLPSYCLTSTDFSVWFQGLGTGLGITL